MSSRPGIEKGIIFQLAEVCRTLSPLPHGGEKRPEKTPSTRREQQNQGTSWRIVLAISVKSNNRGFDWPDPDTMASLIGQDS
jgi:hypothetical protein